MKKSARMNVSSPRGCFSLSVMTAPASSWAPMENPRPSQGVFLCVTRVWECGKEKRESAGSTGSVPLSLLLWLSISLSLLFLTSLRSFCFLDGFNTWFMSLLLPCMCHITIGFLIRITFNLLLSVQLAELGSQFVLWWRWQENTFLNSFFFLCHAYKSNLGFNNLIFKVIW